MPRKYNRTTKRASAPTSVLADAAEMVKKGAPIRSAARTKGINRMTLKRFIDNNGQMGYDRLRQLHQVFTSDQEKELSDHIKDMDDRFHGLRADQCRKLAYEFGPVNNVAAPKNWDIN